MTGIRRFLGMGVQKTSFGHLPLPARSYVAVLTLASLGLAIYCAITWRTANMGQFLLYLACGIMCASMKVWLPGITGTLSVHYLFILASVTELTLPQTVAIGSLSGVSQLFWAARSRPNQVQVLFAFTSMILSSTLTFLVYQSKWPGGNLYSRLFC